MLFLSFRIGADRYVLDAAQVERVLPLLEAKAVPGLPPAVLGLLDYHGRAVPLIDVCLLATGRPTAGMMSSRVILVRYADEAGRTETLALCAEQATGTIERDPADFVATGVEAGTPAYLGPVAADEEGLVQWVRASALLTPELRAMLFQPAGAPP
ncbi:chemotaxis protein CheW [Ancylobacter lacus]|uniref:chemotaxis protein CheW n=1 Tax=Ancylobacter lacus TaxID=2579970 RepID=UPI001BCB7487|nr:chemotaxis protein CheW [Ancylobacter lacus]MBS7539515.1 chemotaxis protein CheW [Ancylobacter lacus]